MTRRKKERIQRLRIKRNKLWAQFRRLPKKSQFYEIAALIISGKLAQVQRQLDCLEGIHPSARYHPVIWVKKTT